MTGSLAVPSNIFFYVNIISRIGVVTVFVAYVCPYKVLNFHSLFLVCSVCREVFPENKAPDCVKPCNNRKTC
jgi:Fe-S-cluster-containing dehydrogenase component